jgi:replicative DNA helicase
MEESIEKLIERCEQEIASTQDAQKKAEQVAVIKDLWRKYRGEDQIVSVEDYLKRIANEESGDELVVMSKIPKLDIIIEGFREGNLVVVSGATKQGKTSFCQTLTENFSEQGVKCLWFTYEVPVKEFTRKFKEIPTFYLPNKITGDTTDWLEKKTVEAIAKYGVRVVFVDHLHYIVDLRAMKQNLSVQIGMVMRDLKKIALAWGVIIFLVAHIKKTKASDMPGLDDMRDSSFVAQEADIVMMVSRLIQEGSEFSNEAIVSVLAHRRTGKMGSVRLLYRDNKFNQVAVEYEK